MASTTAPVGVLPAADRATHPVNLRRLAELHAERVRLDAEVNVLVRQLAANGVGWGAVGRAVGISRQGARQRYG